MHFQNLKQILHNTTISLCLSVHLSVSFVSCLSVYLSALSFFLRISELQKQLIDFLVFFYLSYLYVFMHSLALYFVLLIFSVPLWLFFHHYSSLNTQTKQTTYWGYHFCCSSTHTHTQWEKNYILVWYNNKIVHVVIFSKGEKAVLCQQAFSRLFGNYFSLQENL
jgi:hypothetical protein